LVPEGVIRAISATTVHNEKAVPNQHDQVKHSVTQSKIDETSLRKSMAHIQHQVKTKQSTQTTTRVNSVDTIDIKTQNKCIQRLNSEKFYSQLKVEVLTLTRLTDQAKRQAHKIGSKQAEMKRILSLNTTPPQPTIPTTPPTTSAQPLNAIESPRPVPVKSLCCCSSQTCPCESEVRKDMLVVELQFQGVAQEVVVATEVDNWTGRHVMKQSISNPSLWTTRVSHRPFVPLQFKFIVDGVWTTTDKYDTVCNNGNTNNSIVPTVFEWTLPVKNGDEVFIAGDFSNWEPLRMAFCHHRNSFLLKHNLSRTGLYEFKFKVDSEWRTASAFGLTSQSGFENNFVSIM
jgi:hypothetical protein